MKIIRVWINNFGRLSDVNIDFEEGINVFCEENGWGKSTLADFIKVMLYGFENENAKDGYKKERKKYKPWQGGVYGGQLTFRLKDGVYIINRTFGAKESDDTFEVRDARTNLVTDRFSKKVGEDIFKLDVSSFKKTIYISGGACETEATDGINAKLGNLVELTDDINNYEKVEKKLKDILNGLSATRKTGALYKNKEEIAILRKQIADGAYIETSYEKISRLLMEEKNRLSEIKKENGRLLKKQQYDILLEDYKKRRKVLEEERSFFKESIPDLEELDIYISKAGALKGYKESIKNYRLSDEKPTESNAAKKFGVFAGILLAIIGLILVFVNMAAGITGMAIGICVMAAGILSGKNKNSDKADENRQKALYEDCQNELQNYILNLGYEVKADIAGQLNEIKEHLYSFRMAVSEYERAYKAKEIFEMNHDVTQMVDLDKNDMEEIYKIIQSYQIQLNNLDEQRDEITAMEEELSVLENKKRDMEHRKRILEAARKYLTSSKETFTARYMEPVLEAFKKYYFMLTGDSTGKFHIDANTNITIDEQGLQREPRFFSTGYRDLIGICLRMALIDSMYQEEKPWIVLDDSFANLDDVKLAFGLEFIKNISKEYQIIYFTCNSFRTT